MVGALVEVGRGRLTPDDIRVLLHQRDRSKCPGAAPPDGLFLTQVHYPAHYLRLDSFPASALRVWPREPRGLSIDEV